MKSFIEQAQFYAAYHQQEITRSTHFIGIPLIILSLMILLGFVKIIIPGVFASDFAWFATIAALIYYYLLNWRLALVLTPILFFLLWIAHWFSKDGPTMLGLSAFILCFVVGWAFQLYGHYLEGKKPALVDNFAQALIAPLYLVAELFFMAGYMKPLYDEIHKSSYE